MVGAEPAASAGGHGGLPQAVQAAAQGLSHLARRGHAGGRHEKVQELRAAVHRAEKRRDERRPLAETHGPDR